jgi:uncharacterized membrane protein YbhN (UPF0104 family)
VKLTDTHRRLFRVALTVVVIVFCVMFVRRLDFAKLRDALAGARWQLVAVAALINFAHLLIKAGRWGVLLAPMGRVSLLQLFRYLLGGYAASNVLPARFGEVLRVFYLRPHGISSAGAAGVQILEKAYEVVGLLLLVVPVPFVLHLPPLATDTVLLLAIGGLVAAAVMVWMARHHRIPREGWFGRVGQGVAVLRDPRAALGALALSIAIWLTDAFEVMLVMASVGIAPGLATALLTLLFINFFIAAPSTPGQVGIFEAGAVTALTMLGITTEKALAFALLYHFMQAIPVTLAGLEALVLWRSLRAAPAPAASPPPSP